MRSEPKVVDSDLVTASVLCAHPDTAVPAFLRQALSPVDVVVAPNGYEALKSINALSFDAYVVDYWLPDWTGVNLCREIRKTDPNVPICIYTKAQSHETRRRALRAGADLFLSMPQDAGEVRERLETLLRSRREHLAHAEVAAECAAQAELDRQGAFNRAPDAGGKVAASHLVQRNIKAAALKAFLGAGGTCANFERIWTHLYAKVAQTFAAASAQAA